MYRGALACVIVVGSLVFWIGIPLFWIWVAGQLIDEYPSIYLLALAACPLTMIVWGWVLYRVNAIYVDLTPPPPRRAGRPALGLARQPERRSHAEAAPGEPARREHDRLGDHRPDGDGGLVLRLRA